VSFLRRLLGGSGGDQEAARAPRAGDAEPEWLSASEATFDATADRQRVTVWLRLSDPAFENEREQQRLFRLENELMRALDASGTGEHDTNALESGYLAIRLVGDDADAIVAVALPLLEDAPRGTYLAVRRGPAGRAEDRLDLDSLGNGPGR
jgi:hypothetical protein